jgi:putative ABC transport system permease protein
MSLREAAVAALRALVANRMRSLLTTLGVIIGVFAVVLLVAIGQGARDEVTGTIEGLGSNLLFVFPGDGDFSQAPARSPFTLADVDRIVREVGDERRVAAQLISGETIRADGESAFVTLFGITQGYDEVVVRTIARGQAISANDIATGRRVVVLGAGVAERLFAGVDPIGRTVTLGGIRFRVSGVLEAVGGSLFGPDRDQQVMVPVTVAQRIFGTDRVDAIFVRATTTAGIPDEVERVERALSRLDSSDYSILTQDEIIGIVGDILELLTWVLAAIAGISLLVGGVGVSNIMLVSVSERIREIGLRKALGARTRDITVQFLVEAVTLTGLGGVIGLGAGIGAARIVDAISPVPAVVTTWSVALALGVSVVVGVVFGVWPARRAGRLDPVVALRHD